VHDYLSDGVKEQILLSVLCFLDEREDLFQEIVGVADSNVSQADRGGLADFFVL